MEVSKIVIGIVAAVVLALIVAAGVLGYYVYKLTSSRSSDKDGGSSASTEAHFDLRNDSILLDDGEATEKAVDGATAESPVTIFFGHPGCFHCAASVSSFEEAAGDAAGKSVFVADANRVSSSVIQKYNVEAFPSVLRFSSPSERAEYSGDRSAASFAAFIEGA